MPISYDMKFSVADVARILKTEKEFIKTWAYKFSEYLSSNANPGTGNIRQFIREDIRVMALILTYWEEDPDIEYIKICLSSNDHFENDLINDLMIEITPIFVVPPEGMDETWKNGVVYGGLAQIGDTFFLADSYKIAGDRLIDAALQNEEQWELFCPAVYNYRHSTELYMKAVIGKWKQSHDLIPLFVKLKVLLKKDFNADIPEWFEKIVHVFNDFDPDGTIFRYGGGLILDEVFINFIQLKTVMNWAAQSFQNIRSRQRA